MRREDTGDLGAHPYRGDRDLPALQELWVTATTAGTTALAATFAELRDYLRTPAVVSFLAEEANMATSTVDSPRSTRAARASEGGVLTLKAAADLLNVDRAFLAQILAAGALPSAGKGPQRHVLKDDLLAYKREWDVRRAQACDRLLDLSLEARLDTIEYDTLLADRP